MAINRPDEVAILIAPPLTEDEYRARIPSSDWLGPHGETEQIRDKYWNGVYSPFIAQPLLELINKAQPLGARLIEASLPAVEVATAERPIVVVMAHWKDSEVHIEDLRKGFPPAAWLERAGRHPSPLARWIAPRLAGKSAGGIVDVLRQSLYVPLPEKNPAASVTVVRESAITTAANRRQELESIFDGMLAPGNRLELVDGLYSKEAFENAVAPDFSGVIDFAACVSTILADHVAHRRYPRIGTVQSPQPIEFVQNAPVVATTLELLDTGRFSYLEARTHAKLLWDQVPKLMGVK